MVTTNTAISAITRFELENIISQCLKEHKDERLQLNVLRGYVEAKTSDAFMKLNERKFMEIFHSYLRSGILLPGIVGESGQSECNLPWFSISEYGREVLEREEFISYDPEGYIELLKAKIQNLDDIILHYISEAVRAFHNQLLVSSMLTLGCASERLIILLQESFLCVAGSDSEKLRRKCEAERDMSKRQKILWQEILQIKETIPKELLFNLDIYMDQFFNFIRINRNEKGHPKKLDLDRRVVYGNLQIFPSYAEKIYNLINHFKNSTK